ncbi:MAG: trypsin-like peptidase domain-containing protein [Rhodobacter sp.]|nr:trypsin-like peptidase domain-containing protein [Rhodobacter sp.]
MKFWKLNAFVAALFLFASQVPAQTFVFSPSSWGQLDLNLSESTISGSESILGASAKWERLNKFPISSRERQFSAPVGRLEIRLGNAVATCTAFLISETSALTNNHCIPGDAGPIREAVLTMGYYSYGSSEGVKVYPVTVGPIKTSGNLDFSLVSVSGSPGEEWGFLKFAQTEPKKDDPLMIIHHPAGQVKHITRFDCFAGPRSETDDAELLHTCDTVRGSSGSPVLNQDGEIVALHFAGTALKGEGAYNFSKIGSEILARLESEDTPVDEGNLQSLHLERTFEAFLLKDDVTQEDVDLCRQLRVMRTEYVPKKDIEYYKNVARECWERGAIAKFEFEISIKNADEMLSNLSKFNQSQLRLGNCEDILSDISQLNINNWNSETLRMSAFCGLSDEEIEVISREYSGKGTWAHSLKHIVRWKLDIGLTDDSGSSTGFPQIFLGVALKTLGIDDIERLQLNSASGAIVLDVDEEGVLRALKKDDVILSIAGAEVRSAEEAIEILTRMLKEERSMVTMKLMRRNGSTSNLFTALK